MILPEYTNGMPGSSALIGEDGSFRLELAPGDYQLTATTEPHWSSNVPDMTQNGLVEITVGSSPSQGVTVPVGRAAVVTGSISFDGGQPPEHPGSVSVPFSAPYAGACRATERVEIAEDWTFKVEGLLGTCRAPVASTFGRWTLTSVTIDGQEMLNGTMKFEPGQRISNVALVFSDRRGGIKLRVADGKGQLTQEYVALAFPADRQQWIPWKSFVRPFTPIREEIRDLASASGRRLPESSRDTIALPVGDYYVVALDDFLLQTQLADPGLLERLIPSATRISVTEGAPREVLLQRRISSDLK